MNKYGGLFLASLLWGGIAWTEESEVVDAPAESGKSWLSQGRLSLAGRALEDNEEYVADALIPLWLPERGAIFLDVRGSFLGGDEEEVNAGLVARRHVDRLGVILGLNAFYDSRWTINDNRFEQVGGGIEVLSQWVDVRANYYHPFTDEFILDETSDTQRTTSGRRRIETTSVYRNYEEALEGYDAEIGFWLPFVSRYVPTAIHAGYYEFNSDLIDDDEFRGMKARLEVRVHPNITLDGEWYEEDALNRSEYIAGVRIQVPLDFWRTPSPRASGGPYQELDSRMSEFVHRDFRIRTIETGPVLFARSTSESVGGQNPPPAPLPPPIVCRDEFVTDPVTGTISVVTICE